VWIGAGSTSEAARFHCLRWVWSLFQQERYCALSEHRETQCVDANRLVCFGKISLHTKYDADCARQFLMNWRPQAGLWSRSLVRLRANPKEDVRAGRTATERVVGAVEEVVTEHGQREPVCSGEISRELGIDAPTVRAGRAQHDFVAYRQVQNANRRRWGRGDGEYLAAESMNRAYIRIVRSRIWHGPGDGAVKNVICFAHRCWRSEADD